MDEMFGMDSGSAGHENIFCEYIQRPCKERRGELRAKLSYIHECSYIVVESRGMPF